MKENVITLGLSVVTGFSSRGLFHLRITQASPDLGWDQMWSWFGLSAVFVISYIFSNPKHWDLDKTYTQTLYALVHSNERGVGDVFLASTSFISFLHLPQFENETIEKFHVKHGALMQYLF